MGAAQVLVGLEEALDEVGGTINVRLRREGMKSYDYRTRTSS